MRPERQNLAKSHPGEGTDMAKSAAPLKMRLKGNKASHTL